MPDFTPATLLLDAKATLGEGSIWYDDALWWIDIEKAEVHRFDPGTARDQSWKVPSKIGTIVPRASKGAVVALESGFHFFDPETGSSEPVSDPESDLPDNRFNDGKCSPLSQFWAGTMSMKSKKNAGSLYRLDADLQVTKVLDEVTCSNGIVWTRDGKTMYYIDSPTRRIDAFDHDPSTGEISNRRVVFELPEDEPGVPDGMTIDAEDRLWVAVWGGWKVLCVDPKARVALGAIAVPAAHVTSCAFGGENLDTLYITTARQGIGDLSLQPLAGGLFVAKPGVRGVPAHRFAR